jgi:hypothetical protein
MLTTNPCPEDYPMPEPVQVIRVGNPEFPRWMIATADGQRYWGHGAWNDRQRDGELFINPLDAEEQLLAAQLNLSDFE